MTDIPEKYAWVPGALALLVTFAVLISIGTPYFWPIPEKNLNLITQSQTTLYNGWMVVLTFYFGSTVNSRKSTDTIATMAKTQQAAQSALAPLAGSDGITLAPGQSATAKATDDGTLITPDPVP